jgi:hypothetical protein
VIDDETLDAEHDVEIIVLQINIPMKDGLANQFYFTFCVFFNVTNEPYIFISSNGG